MQSIDGLIWFVVVVFLFAGGLIVDFLLDELGMLTITHYAREYPVLAVFLLMLFASGSVGLAVHFWGSGDAYWR